MKQSKADSDKAAAKFELACGRFFLRAMMIILPIVMVDYASRFFWSHRRAKIERKFPVEVTRHPKPYVMFGGIGHSAMSSGEKLNDLGYRGRSPSGPKPAGEFRVFMLGGSTVFGGEPPIAALLEQLFRKKGNDNVRVYNFGVVSSVSGMELARVLFEIADLGPDLVIMYNGSNDIMLPLTRDPRPGYPFNFIVYENNPLLESDIRAYPGFSLLLYGSNIARYYVSSYFMDRFLPMEQEMERAGWNSDGWKRALAHKYVGNMLKGKKVANAFGARFIGFFQPVVYYKDPLSPEEQTHGFRPERKGHAIDVRELVRKEIELLDREDKVAVIDLSDVFDNKPQQLFTDNTHIKQQGKDIVAAAMYEHITANGQIK